MYKRRKEHAGRAEAKKKKRKSGGEKRSKSRIRRRCCFYPPTRVIRRRSVDKAFESGSSSLKSQPRNFPIRVASGLAEGGGVPVDIKVLIVCVYIDI